MPENSIVVLNPGEVSVRAARDELVVGDMATDPLTYVKRLVEKIADETGVVSNVLVSPEGKLGVKFHAVIDMRKIAAMLRSRD